ncbi:MAG: peptidase [Acidobacteria bacterium]|nr:peptidase [Acidobacteriota bacterium]
MTFCLAFRVEEGLGVLADTRLTTGNEQVSAGKLSSHRLGGRPFFITTSGLRSGRDKALTYFEEELARLRAVPGRLHEVAEIFGKQVRRVVREDKWSLEGSGLSFNLHTLLGGRLEEDAEPKLYLIYPQANWVEVSRDSPYFCLGQSAYAKPLLDRLLAWDTPLETAFKVGVLAFDAARTSVTDVGLPLDAAVLRREGGDLVEARFERQHLEETAEGWRQGLAALVGRLPAPWLERLGVGAAEGGRP